MDIRPASHFSDGNVSLSVEVANRGDESAADVWASARLGESEAASVKQPLLAAGKSARFELEMGPPPPPPGEHTVVIHVHYSDLNAYPFSAVAVIPVVTDAADPTPEKVEAGLDAVVIRRKGKLTLTLAGPAEGELALRTELIVPEELAVSDPVRNVVAPPGKSRKLVFRIRNLSGRAGSMYRAVAVTDYVDGGRHRSVATAGLVGIAGRRDIFAANRTVWLVAAGLLAALFVLIQFVKSGSFRRSG
jgi:hypothetical protein